MGAKRQTLEVWGDLACFTRPEMKVERFSYPVITPSAARGIFDAIYVNRHEFRWQIVQVDILNPCGPDGSPVTAVNPINYIALRRNEVKEGVEVNAVLTWIAGRKPPEPIFADVDKSFWGTDEKGRTQRQTMALKNVRYYLHAEVRPWPGFENRIPGMEMEFRRRAQHGKCVYQPYLGCREFPAYFRLVEIGEAPEMPVPFDMDIGLMVYDVFDLSMPGTSESCFSLSLFRASISKGSLAVPEYGTSAVFTGERRAD